MVKPRTSGLRLRRRLDRANLRQFCAQGCRAVLYSAVIRGHGPEERPATRQAQSAPMIAASRLWLPPQRSRLFTKSRLGEKLGYIHRHWDGLQVFLTDGRVEMGTNPVENTIRPITLNRKNALLAPSRAFGHAKTLPGNGS